MLLLAPLVLFGPLFMLAAGAWSLAQHGPLGWAGATGLVVGAAATTRAVSRWTWAWWRSTGAG